MAKLIKLDGTRTEVHPKSPTDGFTLEELYGLIGCEMVEIIYLNNDGEGEDPIFIGDEEGRHGPESLNVEATKIYRDSWGIEMPYYQHDEAIKEKVAEVEGTNTFVIDVSRGCGEHWDEPYTIHGNILICRSSEFN